MTIFGRHSDDIRTTYRRLTDDVSSYRQGTPLVKGGVLEFARIQALYAPKETNPGGWPQRMGIQKMQEATSQNRANDAADITKAGKFL